MDSTGNRAISASGFAIPQSQSESQRDGIVFNNELLESATGSFERLAVSGESTSKVGNRFEPSEGNESNGLVGVHEHRSKPAQLSGLNNMSELSSLQEVDSGIVPEQIENQVAYKPRSKAYSLATLAPASSLKGLDNVFNKIELATGLTIDEYVRDRLNESSTKELFNHYTAEQIDSLALSIYNHEEENKATLIGHDTGIGKTRILCGLARYAQQRGMISCPVYRL